MGAPPYEVRVVAEAVGIPVRRLEGWVERGVVAPSIPADGTGKRTRFSREDVLRVALIDELQRLLGINFRPGGVGAKIGRDPLTFAHVDTLFRLAIEGKGPQRWLVIYRKDKRIELRAFGNPTAIAAAAPIALVIDPAALWQRIRGALES